MRFSDILRGIVRDRICTPDPEITGISSNTEKIAKGNVFVAVKGGHTDSHGFIREAVERGAAAVICQYLPNSFKPGVPTAIVSDSRNALALAADNFYGNPSKKMHFIGVTGTNGKTTTAHMIHHILISAGIRAGIVGTTGCRFASCCSDSAHTTPEAEELYSLFADFAARGCTHVVMEASSQGLVQRRCDALHFDSGVFLNISPEHLDYHGTMENYLNCKLLLAQRADELVVNMDEPKFADAFGGRGIRFSRLKNECGYYSTDEISEVGRIGYKLHCPSGVYGVQIPVCGDYNIYNSLAAVIACRLAGVTESKCVSALSDFGGVQGRFELVTSRGGFDVIIDYAHTPDSLRKVLTTARSLCNNKLIVVFGCGGDRDRSKRPLMGRIASENADMVYITDDNPRTEDSSAIISDILEGVPKHSGFKVIPDRRKAITAALETASKGDMVLLAGKGHEQYQILKQGRVEFSEYDIVNDFFKHKRA